MIAKSKGQIMRVAPVLHAIFSIDPTYELTSELSTESIAAAINLIEVCNEHTKIMAGRSSSSPGSTCIRESVDSLCRDGADTPIVCVHRKAFLTRERSRSKPFWAPSYSIQVVLYPKIPPK